MNKATAASPTPATLPALRERERALLLEIGRSSLTARLPRLIKQLHEAGERYHRTRATNLSELAFRIGDLFDRLETQDDPVGAWTRGLAAACLEDAIALKGGC